MQTRPLGICYLMYSLFTKQELIVAVSGRHSQALGYELPVIETLRINRITKFNIAKHIEAEVYVGRIVDTAFQLITWNTGSFGQQLSATIATI